MSAIASPKVIKIMRFTLQSMDILGSFGINRRSDGVV